MIKGMTVSNRGNRLSLVLGLILGIVAAVLIAVYLAGTRDEGRGGSSSGPGTPTVVAATDIPEGARITAEMVKVKNIPQSDVLGGTFQTTDTVVNKVAASAIVKDEQVLGSRVLDTTDEGQLADANALAEIVPTDEPAINCAIASCGLRGVSISVSPQIALGGLIRTGDRVDVIAAFGDGSAITIITDAEVLALDREFNKVTTASESGEESDQAGSDDQPDAASASLALTPEEAQRVAAAEEMTSKNVSCKGGLRLSLRHEGNPGTFDVPAGKGACAYIFAQFWGLKADQPTILTELLGS